MNYNSLYQFNETIYPPSGCYKSFTIDQVQLNQDDFIRAIIPPSEIYTSSPSSKATNFELTAYHAAPFPISPQKHQIRSCFIDTDKYLFINKDQAKNWTEPGDYDNDFSKNPFLQRRSFSEQIFDAWNLFTEISEPYLNKICEIIMTKYPKFLPTLVNHWLAEVNNESTDTLATLFPVLPYFDVVLFQTFANMCITSKLTTIFSAPIVSSHYFFKYPLDAILHCFEILDLYDNPLLTGNSFAKLGVGATTSSISRKLVTLPNLAIFVGKYFQMCSSDKDAANVNKATGLTISYCGSPYTRASFNRDYLTFFTQTTKNFFAKLMKLAITFPSMKANEKPSDEWIASFMELTHYRENRDEHIADQDINPHPHGKKFIQFVESYISSSESTARKRRSETSPPETLPFLSKKNKN
jgi:hypothetical protein